MHETLETEQEWCRVQRAMGSVAAGPGEFWIAATSDVLGKLFGCCRQTVFMRHKARAGNAL
eukprot:5117818-Amphidinium_carterae.1